MLPCYPVPMPTMVSFSLSRWSSWVSLRAASPRRRPDLPQRRRHRGGAGHARPARRAHRPAPRTCCCSRAWPISNAQRSGSNSMALSPWWTATGWTPASGRAEIRWPDGTVAIADADTVVDLVDAAASAVGPRHAAIQIASGALLAVEATAPGLRRESGRLPSSRCDAAATSIPPRHPPCEARRAWRTRSATPASARASRVE